MATKDTHDTWTLRPDEKVNVTKCGPLRYRMDLGSDLSVVVSADQIAELIGGHKKAFGAGGAA